MKNIKPLTFPFNSENNTSIKQSLFRFREYFDSSTIVGLGENAQNKAISNNLEKVYSSFSIIGGTHFDGWYWSSTEDGAGKDTPKVFALISSLTKGRATSTSKRNSFKIRHI